MTCDDNRKSDISSEAVRYVAHVGKVLNSDLQNERRMTAPTQRVKAVSAPATVSTPNVDSRGRTTLPKAIRQHLDAGPGDRVEFELLPDGRGALLRANPSRVMNGLPGKIGRSSAQRGKPRGRQGVRRQVVKESHQAAGSVVAIGDTRSDSVVM
jgi:AbrB family looped-hinge helix DNA binding protein